MEYTELNINDTLIGKIEKGGIGVIDTELQLKAVKAYLLNISRLSETSLNNEVINAYWERVNLNFHFILLTTEGNLKDFTVINHKEIIISYFTLFGNKYNIWSIIKNEQENHFKVKQEKENVNQKTCPSPLIYLYLLLG